MVETIDSFPHVNFREKTNTAILFSALENRHTQNIVKNRPIFKNLTKLIEKSMNRSIAIEKKLRKNKLFYTIYVL